LSGEVEDVQWEKQPLEEIAKDNPLAAYTHYKFWKGMDALRDKIELEEIWYSGNIPWKIVNAE
jgi:glucose-1-phosphate cytidylyltransferase